MVQTKPDIFEYHHSGDALYDRYSQAVIEREAESEQYYAEYVERLIQHFGLEHLRTSQAELSKRLGALEDKINAEELIPGHAAAIHRAGAEFVLPAELLAGWEAEFGQDPRYWQLLYWQEKNRWHADKTIRNWDFRPQCYEGLLQAWEKNPADAASMLILDELLAIASDSYVSQRMELQAQMQSYYDSSEGTHEMEAYSEPVREAAYFEAVSRQAQELCRIAGLSRPVMYEAALAAAPDWAQVHYACLPAAMGDPQAVIERLEAGNRAPENKMLRIFPHSLARECAHRGGIPGSIQLFWTIDIHSAVNPCFNLLGLRAQLNTAMQAAGEELKLQLHKAATVMFARLLQTAQQSGHESSLAAMALGKSCHGLGRRLDAQGVADLSARLEDCSQQLFAHCMTAIQVGQSDVIECRARTEAQRMEDGTTEGFDLDLRMSRRRVDYLYRNSFEAVATDEARRIQELLPLALEVERLLV